MLGNKMKRGNCFNSSQVIKLHLDGEPAVFEAIKSLAYSIVANNFDRKDNRVYLQVKNLTKLMDGGKQLFNLCFTFWTVSFRNAQVVNSNAFENKDKHHNHLFRLLEENTRFLNNNKIPTLSKQLYFSFLMDNLPSALEYLKIDAHIGVFKSLFAFFENCYRLAFNLDYFTNAQSIASCLLEIRRIVSQCRLPVEEKDKIVVKIDRFIHKLIYSIFDSEFDLQKDIPDIQFKLFSTAQLNERNIILIAETLVYVILNVEKKFINVPVYIDSKDAVYFEILMLNWRSLVSILEKYIDSEDLSVKPGFCQVLKKIEVIKQEFENQKEDFSKELIKQSGSTTESKSLKVELAKNFISIEVLKGVLVELTKVLVFKEEENAKETNSIKNKIENIDKKDQDVKVEHNKIKDAIKKISSENIQILSLISNESDRSVGEVSKLNQKFKKIKENYLNLIAPVKSEIEALSQSISSCSSQTSKIELQLQQTRSRLKNSYNQKKSVLDNINRLNCTISELNEKLENLKLEESKCLSENEKSKEHISTLYADIDQKKSQIIMLKGNLRNESSSQQKKMALKLTQELDAKFNLLKDTENQLASLESNQLNLMFQSKIIDKQIQSEQDIGEKLSAQLMQLTNELKFLESFETDVKENSPKTYLKSISTKFKIPLENIEEEMLLKLSGFSNNNFSFIYGGRVRDGILHLPSRDIDIVVFIPRKEFLGYKEKNLYGFHKTENLVNHWQKRQWVSGIEFSFDISVCLTENMMSFCQKPVLKINSLLADFKGNVYDANSAINELLTPNQYPYLGVIGNFDERIQTDPFRIVRIIGLAKRLGRKIDSNLWEIFEYCAHNINNLPLGKYLSALDKLFDHHAGDKVFDLLFSRFKLLKQMFPFLCQISDQRLSYYLVFLKKQWHKIYSGSFGRKEEGFHPNNGYLALLLFPVFDAFQFQTFNDKRYHTLTAFFNYYHGFYQDTSLKNNITYAIIKCLSVFDIEFRAKQISTRSGQKGRKHK